MKRLLMATTALCLGAGTAAAQDMMMDGPSLAITGGAEMGAAGEKGKSARFHTDIDISFKGTGTMDSGVTWSAVVDLDEGGDGAPAHGVDEDGGVTIAISQPQGFGTLTMGDVDGGYDWAIAGAREAGPGSIADDHEHGGSGGNEGLDGDHDGEILQWNREIGSGFSLAASVELHDHEDGEQSHDPIVGVGGQYSMSMGAGKLALGLGYQMGSAGYTDKEMRKAGTGTEEITLWDNELEATAVGGSVKMDFSGEDGNGIVLIATGEMREFDGSVLDDGDVTDTADIEHTHLGVGLGYTVGAISLGVNVGTNVSEWATDDDPDEADEGRTALEKTTNGVGFSAAYDLGGGASLHFGVGSSETEYDWNVQDNSDAENGGGATGWDHSTDANKWSLGVAFAF